MNTSPKPFYIPLNRRRFLSAITKVSAAFTLPGFLAEALAVTPTVTQGPYYPLADDIPLDKDNDLVQVNDSLTLAGGDITWVTGTVYDSTGAPVKNALVELWHADREGDYSYSTGAGRNSACDPNFAGFGQFLTGSTGRFRFRTVKAGLYNGRTRHYHWGVTLPGRTSRVTTQTGWNETARDLNGNVWATQNSNDNVFSTVSNAALRSAMLLNFTAVEGGVAGEVASSWDYYSGLTPLEHTYGANDGKFLAENVEIVAGPNGGWRAAVTIPAAAGYTYELYTSQTLGDLDSRCVPFSLTAQGAVNLHKYTATVAGTLRFYLPVSPDTDGRRFFTVSYRVPGANTGTP